VTLELFFLTSGHISMVSERAHFHPSVIRTRVERLIGRQRTVFAEPWQVLSRT